jgi:hypothetical protein
MLQDHLHGLAAERSVYEFSTRYSFFFPSTQTSTSQTSSKTHDQTGMVLRPFGVFSKTCIGMRHVLFRPLWHVQVDVVQRFGKDRRMSIWLPLSGSKAWEEVVMSRSLFRAFQKSGHCGLSCVLLWCAKLLQNYEM